MVNRSLGRTELMVSPLSLGSGGGPEKDICRLVHHALDLGINLFDSSRGYGDSELILGSALKGTTLFWLGSFGRPRTRSPMMFRWTWSVPP